MKYLLAGIIGFFILFAVGAFLAPFVALLWALFTFSLVSVLKALIALYILMIPVSFIADARKRQG